ncbi:UNVERIFIED_CONTAM: hypothetical protein NCL1_36543 [Trichonephila clavipes]
MRWNVTVNLTRPCDFDQIPKIKEPIRDRRFATREDIANVVHLLGTPFTHGAENAETGGSLIANDHHAVNFSSNL